MPIEGLTVGQLIEHLRQYPPELPVVLHSYEDGYDPLTDSRVLTVTERPDREWYNGIYATADQNGERVLLLASRYYKNLR